MTDQLCICHVIGYVVVHRDDAGDDVNGVLHIHLLARKVFTIGSQRDASPRTIKSDGDTKYSSSIPQLLLKFD